MNPHSLSLLRCTKQIMNYVDSIEFIVKRILKALSQLIVTFKGIISLCLRFNSTANQCESLE